MWYMFNGYQNYLIVFLSNLNHSGRTIKIYKPYINY